METGKDIKETLWYVVLVLLVVLLTLIVRDTLEWAKYRLVDPYGGECEVWYPERMTFPFDCKRPGGCTVSTTVDVCAKWRE